MADYDSKDFLTGLASRIKKSKEERIDKSIEKMRQPQKRPEVKPELFQAADSETKTTTKSIPESEQKYKDIYSTPEQTISGEDFKRKQDKFKMEREVRDLKQEALKANQYGDKKAEQTARDKLANLAKKADADDMVDAFEKGIKRSAKFVKGAAGAIPLVGGLLSAGMTGEASAAVPFLGDASDLGPGKGSIDAIIQDPNTPKEERERIFEELRKRLSK